MPSLLSRLVRWRSSTPQNMSMARQHHQPHQQQQQQQQEEEEDHDRRRTDSRGGRGTGLWILLRSYATSAPFRARATTIAVALVCAYAAMASFGRLHPDPADLAADAGGIAGQADSKWTLLTWPQWSHVRSADPTGTGSSKLSYLSDGTGQQTSGAALEAGSAAAAEAGAESVGGGAQASADGGAAVQGGLHATARNSTGWSWRGWKGLRSLRWYGAKLCLVDPSPQCQPVLPIAGTLYAGSVRGAWEMGSVCTATCRCYCLSLSLTSQGPIGEPHDSTGLEGQGAGHSPGSVVEQGYVEEESGFVGEQGNGQRSSSLISSSADVLGVRDGVQAGSGSTPAAGAPPAVDISTASLAELYAKADAESEQEPESSPPARDPLTSSSSSQAIPDDLEGWKLPLSLAPGIPGSALHTAEQAAAFRARMACLSERGKWVLDGSPRVLPWPLPYRWRRRDDCDERHTRSGGLAGDEADEVAIANQTGVTPAPVWNVRDSTKYRWQPEDECGRWSPFDSRSFLEAVGKSGGGMMILGDSLSGQFFSSLMNNLVAYSQAEKSHDTSSSSTFSTPSSANVVYHPPRRKELVVALHALGLCSKLSVPADCVRWQRQLRSHVFQELCVETMCSAQASSGVEGGSRDSEDGGTDADRGVEVRDLQGSASGGDSELGESSKGRREAQAFRIRFTRTNWLTLTMELVLPSAEHKRAIEIPWLQAIEEGGYRIVVLNRGAHVVSNEQFEPQLNRTVRTLRRLFPDLLIIYRNSPPGHAFCIKHNWGPLAVRQPLRMITKYGWDVMVRQNPLAQRIVEAVGGVYLDVDAFTSLRSDGHISHNDCLHYCAPGPIDVWVQMLHNALLDLL